MPSEPPTIIQRGSVILEQVAPPVLREEFGTLALHKIIDQMNAALALCDDGVALAAPQISISKRIFIVADKVFRELPDDPLPPNLICINPILSKRSASKRIIEEGCLSVRGWYGKVERAEKTTIEAYDLHGKKFRRGASGLLAQIFQHEIDHLDGILFIDKALSLEQIRKP